MREELARFVEAHLGEGSTFEITDDKLVLYPGVEVGMTLADNEELDKLSGLLEGREIRIAFGEVAEDESKVGVRIKEMTVDIKPGGGQVVINNVEVP